MSDFNAGVIDEFRANHGRVGGMFEGAPLLLLHSTGARSGEARLQPLVYLAEGERLVIFASKAGADTNPAWYHNLVAHPAAEVEVGDDRFAVRATEATGEERDRLYAEQSRRMPNFADYEQRTTRKIPVIVLERA
jgi:deazaflavin-dependent oxidoreductase (nitroreductase family)